MPNAVKMKALPPYQATITCNAPGLSGRTYKPYTVADDPQHYGYIDDVDRCDVSALQRHGWVEVVDTPSAQDELQAIKARLDTIERHLGLN